MKESDIIITINSQSGIEASLLNKNVFSIEDAFYANKGFGHVYKNFEDLESMCESYQKAFELSDSNLDEKEKIQELINVGCN